jgi:alkaline phosphatase D
LLAAHGRRAFCEFMPTRQTLADPGRIYRKLPYGPLLDVFLLDMRSYRGPNDHQRDKVYGPACYFLGPAQTEWLKRGLLASAATWKVIAVDLPLGVVSEDAAAQGDGAPLGR